MGLDKISTIKLGKDGDCGEILVHYLEKACTEMDISIFDQKKKEMDISI